MGLGDRNVLATFCILIPAIMIMTKMKRMDHREEHEFHIEMRRRADFWERANRFSLHLQDAVLESVMEDARQRKHMS